MEQEGKKVRARDQERLASDLTFLEMDVRLGRMKVEPRKREGKTEQKKDCDVWLGGPHKEKKEKKMFFFFGSRKKRRSLKNQKDKAKRKQWKFQHF